MPIHVPTRRYALSFFFVRFVFVVVKFSCFFCLGVGRRAACSVGLDARTHAATPEDVGQDPRYTGNAGLT